MSGMLASVSNLDEALQVLAMDVDIIDLKAPDRGALGALSTDAVKTIVAAIDKQCTLSATVGDLPMQPDLIASAVKNMATTGVDYIKIGFFPGGDWPGTLDILAGYTRAGLALIAVLFADTALDLNVIGLLKDAGFKGVMLDTMDKHKGSLTQILPHSEIRGFIDQANKHHLLSGLAGSLRREDISQLSLYKPDYLGFRGALCREHNRTAQLDNAAIELIKRTVVHSAL